jgi:hypothetical protein
MQTIVVISPLGRLVVTVLDGGNDEVTVRALIQSAAFCFNYKSILSGVDAGRLIDNATDVVMGMNTVVVPGEYRLDVLGY